MELPPYLLTTGTAHRGVSVGVAADASSTVVEMTVHGRWSPELRDQVADTLRMCEAGPTTGIIIDLQNMGDLHGVSLPFWTHAARSGRLGSVLLLALCLPTATMLSYRLRQSDGRQPLVFPTVPQARVAIAGRMSPTHRRLQARLPGRASAVRTARELVAQACHAWHIPQLRPNAALIMSELATNAVQHARTEMVATVIRAGDCLHLAVRDGDSRFPRLAAPDPDLTAAGGRGLRLVHGIATAWGAMPARGGKVVWATVAPG
ncbi:anti-sigma regulatory factor (Ser/Thr protein kinase) [Actinoplanes lutulentus]|uniref:ATP-binding protein n=1 Tax=Actinoplanes lutulentus TaxID=1287878 RepID=UPI0015EC8AA8|nr:ATP-binding protein [Actinoplanes lutulentus]MBB2943197.1 anti-sigma regulatory factor (Ser/Thr protein kinase) [Actinoplanes lutulentus]